MASPDQPADLVGRQHAASSDSDRREFIAKATTIAMLGGLAAGYGAAGAIAGRYLYPARPREMAWLFVATVGQLAVGESLAFKTPTGESVTIARQSKRDEVESFAALSSTCPHLGCQVHWQSKDERFFCPCHNGTFDGAGVATGGPPADAGQSLPRFALKIEKGLLYIETPVMKLAGGSDDHTAGMA
jgi:nitrite reductase/ring-hydroxylating ferredoxin subunit